VEKANPRRLLQTSALSKGKRKTPNELAGEEWSKTENGRGEISVKKSDGLLGSGRWKKVRGRNCRFERPRSVVKKGLKETLAKNKKKKVISIILVTCKTGGDGIVYLFYV